MNRVYASYRLLMKTVTSSNWRRRSIREELEVFRAEVCIFKK